MWCFYFSYMYMTILLLSNRVTFFSLAALFAMFAPLLGEGSILFANGSDGRLRHDAYNRCFNGGALSTYYSIVTKVSLKFHLKILLLILLYHEILFGNTTYSYDMNFHLKYYYLLILLYHCSVENNAAVTSPPDPLWNKTADWCHALPYSRITNITW